ncbi:caspase-3-like [Acanthaster planci]|uniref:Caspase-3-like n=1 Tax=Acanthaster planci TaxID=133434 RepID=A0A8B7YBQ6_ACAPL|nr:caspase-3-like [Acanthaster planci]
MSRNMQRDTGGNRTVEGVAETGTGRSSDARASGLIGASLRDAECPLSTMRDLEEHATPLSRAPAVSKNMDSSAPNQGLPLQLQHLHSDTPAVETVDGSNAEPSIPALSAALLADDRYDMSHCRRGRAVLINNANFEEDTDMPRRLSTQKDVDGLRTALQDMGFSVKVFEDQTCAQIKREVHALSKEDHSDADCLLIAIMSHGDDGEIYGTDGPMPTREITTPFRGDACRSLIGKPKLFIFQACRGVMVDQGVAMDRHDVDEPDALIGYESARTIPTEADFLLAYSSPKGYASWRNATSGAWFIQSLVQAMEAYGHSWELTRLLTLVNRMVALQYESLSENVFMTRKKQMPCFVSTLTKELFFRPKSAKEMSN